MNKTLIGLMILLAVLMACTQKGGDQQTVKIGSIFPLTGDAAQYGVEFQRVALIAVDEINAKGGINGEKLEIDFQDGRCNPKDSNSIIKKFAEIDQYKIVLGGACSGETLGSTPIAEQSKILMISPAATSPDISKAGDFIFRTVPSDAYAGNVAAEKAIELGYKKAAVISELSDYAQGLKRVFESGFKEKGGEIVASESFASEDSDFRAQLTKVKGNNPDVIYLAVQTPAKGELLLKQIKELGINIQMVIDAIMIRGIIKNMGSQLDGMIGIEPDFDEQAPKAKGILDKYRAKYGEPQFPFYDAATYDAVYLIAEALTKYRDNTEAIRDYWYSLKDWPGAIGPITFDKNGDLTMNFRAMKVENGEMQKMK